MEDYRALADAVAEEISTGRLRPGERLPTQRAFARERGVAASTAARVYAEVVRRGLAIGEVGRGTFVRAGDWPVEPSGGEPALAQVDLELNFPALPNQSALLSESLARVAQSEQLTESLQPVGVAGSAAHRSAAASALARTGWSPAPDRVLFAGNGRQAIAAAIAALVRPGERLGVESLTYPVVKAIAGRLGAILVPLPMDGDGIEPHALRIAHRKAPMQAIYVQPTLHNPLGITMPTARRAELVTVFDELGLIAIEDTVNGFLRDEVPPLVALAPDRVVLVDSLSKRLAPGLTAGFVVPPPAIADPLAGAIRSGGWAAGRFALDAATGWIADGTHDTIVRGKRRDAAERQRIAAERLAGFDLRADTQAYHCWWKLPQPWRAETFVAAAGRRGIAVTPAGAFAVGPAHGPNAVRLALASPPLPTLTAALDTLAALARAHPDDAAVD